MKIKFLALLALLLLGIAPAHAADPAGLNAGLCGASNPKKVCFWDGAQYIPALSIDSVTHTVGPGSVQFTPLGTGAVPEPLSTTLARIVEVDQYGAPTNGTDATAAFTNAQAALPGGKGTLLTGSSCYTFTQNLDVNTGVEIQGAAWPGFQRAGADYTTVPSCLIHDAAHAILLHSNAKLRQIVVKQTGLTTPASIRAGINLVATFAGTGVTYVSGANDAALEDVVILGFGTCVSIPQHGRPRMVNVAGDCTNGLSSAQVHDVANFQNIEFIGALTSPISGGSTVSYVVSGAADNGSGFYRLTVPSNIVVTGDKVNSALIAGAIGANGPFTATVIDSTHIDTNLPVAPTPTGNVTILSKEITSLSSVAGLIGGQTISGTGIPVSTTITTVDYANNKIYINKFATATNTGVTLTVGNSAFSGNGVLILDSNRRFGTAFDFTNSEFVTCLGCYAYGYTTGIHMGTGAVWQHVGYFFVDGNAASRDISTYGIVIDGTSAANSLSHGTVTSGIYNQLYVNNAGNGNGTDNVATDVKFGTFGGPAVDVEQGKLILSASPDGGAGYVLVGPGAASLTIDGSNLSNDKLVTATDALQSVVKIDTASALGSGSTPVGNGILRTLTLGGQGTNGPNVSFTIDCQSPDTNQCAQFQLTNEAASSGVRNKYFRVNVSGNLQILNSAYSAGIASFADIGTWTISTSGALLQFGGATSSFPALKNISALLAVRLSDDSADGAISFSSYQHSQQEVDLSFTFNQPTTGQTVTLATGTETAIIKPAGTLANLTVTLPTCSAGANGSIARFASSQIITSLTVNATAGSVVAAPSSLAVGGGAKFICRGADTTWYPTL